MKKGVAVPYIIAILLGVAVIGLVGYWLFVSGSQLPKSECDTAQRNWCSQWIAVDPTLASKDIPQTPKPSGYPTGCGDVSKTICNNLGIK